LLWQPIGTYKSNADLASLVGKLNVGDKPQFIWIDLDVSHHGPFTHRKEFKRFQHELETTNYMMENITILALPPHTTDRTQPLDKSIMGPLSKMYNTGCHECIAHSVSPNMTIM